MVVKTLKVKNGKKFEICLREFVGKDFFKILNTVNRTMVKFKNVIKFSSFVKNLVLEILFFYLIHGKKNIFLYIFIELASDTIFIK